MKTKFRKKSDASKQNKDYQDLYIANLILQLITDDEVENFYLSCNDDQFAAFGDIVIDVTCKDRRQIYAIQLHSKKENNISELTSFKIEQYLNSFNEDIKLLSKSIELILHTDCIIMENVNTTELNLKNERVNVEIVKTEENNLEHNVFGNTYMMKTRSIKHNNLFQNFFIYTKEFNVEELKEKTFRLFKDTVGSNESVFNQYLSFIVEWNWTDGEKLKLHKEWITHVIFLYILSPFVKPLFFSLSELVSEKENILREAIAQFDITFLKTENYLKIKHLWSNVTDDLKGSVELNKVAYQLGRIDSEKETNGEALRISKFLLLGSCPMVVEECPEFYDVMKTFNGNSVFLNPLQNFNHELERAFRKLSDLKPFDSYEKILTTFTYSLEGQKEVCLQYLVELDPCLGDMITIDDLISILDNPLLVGQLQNFPPCYIERKLSQILVKLEFLKECNVLSFVSCVRDFDGFKARLPQAKKINVESMETGIYVSEEELSADQLSSFKTKPYYHFRYLGQKCLEWIDSATDEKNRNVYFDRLLEFRIEDEYNNYTILEADLLREKKEIINIICAELGMGKTTLMKNIKKSLPSNSWINVVHVKHHALHFQQHGANVDKFLKHLLILKRKELGNPLNRKIFELLMEQQKIQLFWDGIDEVSEKIRYVVLKIIDAFAKKGIKQCLTSRNNLKFLLEKRFKILSRRLLCFNEKDEEQYFNTRLPDHLRGIFKVMKTNILNFTSYIVGIPLQIYMLTEIILHSENKISTLCNVANLYKHFTDLTFKSVCRNCDVLTEVINFYEIMAYNLHFKNVISQPCEPFITEILKYLTEIVLLKKVGNALEFDHRSYGEYFAASFLFKHNRNIELSSNSKYDTIRFFLDLMLTRGSNTFQAVLYKNPILLEKCTSTDLDCKNLADRTALEVACSWNKKFSEKPFADFGSNPFIIQDFYKKNLDYVYISNHFEQFENLHISIKKLMLLLPFIIPFYKVKYNDFDKKYATTVLYYAVSFDYSLIFECIKNSKSLKDAYTKINPINLLSLALSCRSFTILQNIMLERKYHYTMLDSLLFMLETQLFDNNDVFRFVFNITDERGLKMIHYACLAFDCHVVRAMIEEGATVDVPGANNQFPVHYACMNWKGYEIIKLLATKSAKLEVLDAYGLAPSYYACANANGYEMVKFLIEKDVKQLDKCNESNQLLLHYACKQGFDHRILEFLIDTTVTRKISAAQYFLDQNVENGQGQGFLVHENEDNFFEVDTFNEIEQIKEIFCHETVNVLDRSNRMGIHYACQNEFGYEMVKLLIRKGTKLDNCDESGKTPLHYASSNKKGYEMVELLIDKGADLNACDVCGRTPLHYASGNSDSYESESRGFETDGYEIVKLLLDNGANVYSLDNNGKSPLYYASNHSTGHKIVTLLKGNGANLHDSD